MKRRKAPRTLRAAKAAAERKEAETGAWTFFEDVDINQWGTFSGSTTFSFDTAGLSFKKGDVITIGGSTNTTIFGIDPAYAPVNVKRIHPARRRKAIRKQKDLMTTNITLTSGGSSVICEKITNTEWIVTGDIS